MEQEYSTLCVAAARDFVVKSTRMQGEDLNITDCECFLFNYGIHLTVSLGIEIQSKISTGKTRANDNNPVFRDAAACQSALQECSEREQQRSESPNEAFALVAGKPYGQLRENTPIHEYPIRVHHVYPCKTCGGSGEVSCSACGGSGCTSCSGCGGSGQILRQRQVHDSYRNQSRTEHYYEHCSSCGGSGKRNCSKCGGSGRVSCDDCAGTGYLTRSHSIVTVAEPVYALIMPSADVPDFVRDALYKAGLPNLGEYGPVSESENGKEAEQGPLWFNYAAAVDFGKLRGSVRETEVRWVLYGNPPRIFDAGHALEILLTSDLDALRRAACVKWFQPVSARTDTVVISNFMKSEAHEQMLEANARGKNGDALREELSRAFSVPYLEDSLKSLGIICRSTGRRFMLRWILAGGVAVWLSVILQVITQLKARPGAFQMLFTGAKAAPVQYTNLLPDALAGRLWTLFGNYGLGMAAVALVAALLSSFWWRQWLKFTGGAALQRWCLKRGLCRNRWFVSSLLCLALGCVIIWLLPVWISADGLLFGIFRLDWLMG